MVKLKQTAFAAVDTKGWRKPFILAWTVRGTAKSVREDVGEAWNENNPMKGWAEAQSRGYKVVKITMNGDLQ